MNKFQLKNNLFILGSYGGIQTYSSNYLWWGLLCTWANKFIFKLSDYSISTPMPSEVSALSTDCPWFGRDLGSIGRFSTLVVSEQFSKRKKKDQVPRTNLTSVGSIPAHYYSFRPDLYVQIRIKDCRPMYIFHFAELGVWQSGIVCNILSTHFVLGLLRSTQKKFVESLSEFCSLVRILKSLRAPPLSIFCPRKIVVSAHGLNIKRHNDGLLICWN